MDELPTVGPGFPTLGEEYESSSFPKNMEVKLMLIQHPKLFYVDSPLVLSYNSKEQQQTLHCCDVRGILTDPRGSRITCVLMTDEVLIL